MSLSTDVDLVIVGAGAAGITAARTALAFGANYVDRYVDYLSYFWRAIYVVSACRLYYWLCGL